MNTQTNLIKDVIGFTLPYQGKYLIHARANHFCSNSERFKVFMISRVGVEKDVKFGNEILKEPVPLRDDLYFDVKDRFLQDYNKHENTIRKQVREAISRELGVKDPAFVI